MTIGKTSESGCEVVIDNVSRSYGAVAAVANVSLRIAAGEFVSLLGPSGSGKTTLLMILAGFELPDTGRILIGGRDMTRTPPNQRDIAMVFQRYALFPHMSVADNIAFPLRMRKVEGSERAARVARALDMVKLTGYGDRQPSALSGGQQQRVALARAMVFDPPVILMDEPLGALDKKLRQYMQIELKQLQQRLGATVVYVTHDQEEALTMSDRVAVIHEGRLNQLGTPRELYDNPANAFVADFIGEMNFLDGVVEGAVDGFCQVALAGGRTVARAAAGMPLPSRGARVRVALRPEAVTLDPASSRAPTGSSSGVSAVVEQSIFNGATLQVHLRTTDGAKLISMLSAGSAALSLERGQPIAASWSVGTAIAFEAAP